MKNILNQQSIHFGLGLVHQRLRLQQQMQGMPSAIDFEQKAEGLFALHAPEISDSSYCLSHDVPENSTQTVIEQWHSSDVQAQINIRVSPGASLFYIVFPTSPKILNQMHTLERNITVGKDAQMTFVELSANTQDRVSQTQVTLVASGGRAKLSTAFIGKGHETHHLIHHVEQLAKYTQAEIQSFGILQQKSRGIYRAKVMIDKGAVQAQGSQDAKVLLDGPEVRIDAVPELDVSHNTVSCQHGVGISQLDEQALFYAQSRGIDEVQARQVLKEAHVLRLLSDVPEGKQKEDLKKYIQESII